MRRQLKKIDTNQLTNIQRAAKVAKTVLPLILFILIFIFIIFKQSKRA